MQKDVVSFNEEFDRLLQARLPNLLEPHGELLPRDEDNQKTTEAKSKAGSSHKKNNYYIRNNYGKFLKEGISIAQDG